MKIRIISLLWILASAGCGKTESPEGPTDEQDYTGKQIVVTAVASNKVKAAETVGDATRTSLDGLIMQWVAGDRIGVFSPQAGDNIALTATDNAVNSPFTGSMVWGKGAHDFYSYYPYAGECSDMHAVPVTLPSSQRQKVGGNSDHIATIDCMVASPISAIEPRDEVELQFNHVFALLEFRLLGSGNVSSIAFGATPSTRLTFDSATIDITQSTPNEGKSYSLTLTGKYSPSATLTLDEAAAMTADETTTPALYMMVNPVDLSSQTIYLDIVIDGKTVVREVTGFRVERGKKYTVVVDVEKASELQGYYNSTDYSADGRVDLLQKATSGSGIDIVLMGDAFSDRLVADGTYERTMRRTMENFFGEEPYRSFRDMFNVYCVTAVSRHEVYTETSRTALACWFGASTRIGGDNQRCIDYALHAIPAGRMDDAVIVVVLRESKYAGTCYMFQPPDGDYGRGLSIAYSPLGTSDAMFGQLIHHEANGHGFAKLGDEYFSSSSSIPVGELIVAGIYSTYGWYRNIDFAGDPTKVKWAKFISDPRYASEGLGLYEGAYTYGKGAWRPTQYSIMRQNTGGFNAPSREAIYLRINRLTQNVGWQYDYETFVAWDARNRTQSASAARIADAMNADAPGTFIPLAAPVIVPHPWNESPSDN